MNFRFEASIKRIPRKTEGEWLFLSIRCFQTRTTFLLFFFFALLPPSPLPRCFTFLACGLRAPGIPIPYSVCRIRASFEAYNGKRRFNASLADNRFEYQQLRTLISPCMDPRFEPTHGARPMGLTFPITGRLGF